MWSGFPDLGQGHWKAWKRQPVCISTWDPEEWRETGLCLQPEPESKKSKSHCLLGMSAWILAPGEASFPLFLSSALYSSLWTETTNINVLTGLRQLSLGATAVSFCLLLLSTSARQGRDCTLPEYLRQTSGFWAANAAPRNNPFPI